MAYANFNELQQNVPGEYAGATTSGALQRGLNRVAPPNKRANTETCDYYENQTDREAGEKLVRRWSTSRLFQ